MASIPQPDSQPDQLQAPAVPPRWQRWRDATLREVKWWFFALLLFGFGSIAIGSLRGGVEVSGEAPDFRAPVIAGKTTQKSIALKDLRGKPTVLYFTASWCPACKATTPTVDSFAASHPEVNVLAVAMEDEDDARAYFGPQDRSFAVVAATQQLARDYPVKALPTTLVLDKDGSAVWTRQGVLMPFELNWRVP